VLADQRQRFAAIARFRNDVDVANLPEPMPQTAARKGFVVDQQAAEGAGGRVGHANSVG
jgi:hypothetical protein